MSKLFGSQKFQKSIQLILIVVLLASTFAFLPQPAIAKGKSSVGTLTAKLNGRKVTVSGSGFPKSREFVVTAKSGKGNSAKLGTVNSNVNGGFSQIYTLPDKFKINKSVTVCVKGVKSGKRICTTAKQ